MLKGKKGFTVIEVLVVMVMIFYIVVVSLAIVGNFWYTQEGVLKKINFDYPQSHAVEIVDNQRNILEYSVITIKEEAGRYEKYLLASNIFFNYKIKKARD